MKKVILILTMVMIIFSSSISLATETVVNTPSFSVETSGEIAKNSSEHEEELTQASDKILSNMTKKERKIAEYTDKYNDKFYAEVAYYLDIFQMYSIPVCIILLAIGAFNFYIIGEKKLDKKEQGFGFIMAALCGLVFFQVLPFIFALLVAGK